MSDETAAAAAGMVILRLESERARDHALTLAYQQRLADGGLLTPDQPDSWGAAWLRRMRRLEDIADAAYRVTHQAAGLDELFDLVDDFKRGTA